MRRAINYKKMYDPDHESAIIALMLSALTRGK